MNGADETFLIHYETYTDTATLMQQLKQHFTETEQTIPNLLNPFFNVAFNVSYFLTFNLCQSIPNCAKEPSRVYHQNYVQLNALSVSV